MALFGRRCLPHRSSLSRFLADVDRPCLEAFRTLFEQHTFIEGWTSETIGGIFDRQGRRYLVFDVDATRQAARQRALPCDPTLPAARRRLDAVCVPGYRGRKRGEVVRTRTTALRMHTREVVELFEGGWLELGEGLPHVRVIVARHSAPPPGKDVKVGKRVGEWVYELFMTNLDADGFLAEDILDLYHGRGAFEAVLA